LAVQKIERGKLDSAELALFRTSVTLLNSRINIKDSIIFNLTAQVVACSRQISGYEHELSIRNDLNKVYDSQVKSLQKEVRRQKTKKVLAIIAGGLLEALTLYFVIK